MQIPLESQLIRLLLTRLERISADSTWAHRASGLRGALMRELEQIEAGDLVDEHHLKILVEAGFRVLELAAEVRSRASIQSKFAEEQDHAEKEES